MHDSKSMMQDSRYMMYYLTTIETLFIKSSILHFILNQKSAFQNQQFLDPLFFTVLSIPNPRSKIQNPKYDNPASFFTDN
jgi:hypothetical protein